MRFEPLDIEGAHLVRPQRFQDSRGYFQRTFDTEAMRDAGLAAQVVQTSAAFNVQVGTVRGMHWQVAPAEETKVVACLLGSIFDVLLDMRPGSPTYRQHISVELNAFDGSMLYVPRGVAHGYQTLAPNTLVTYVMSAPHDKACARRLRWDDPAFGIRWPLPVSVIAEADRDAPLWDPSAGRERRGGPSPRALSRAAR